MVSAFLNQSNDGEIIDIDLKVGMNVKTKNELQVNGLFIIELDE